MNAPFFVEPPVPVKERLISLLSALEYGLYPPDGSTDEQRGQALADQKTVTEAIAGVQAADSDLKARRAFMGAWARLGGVARYGITSGSVVKAVAA